jgi:hypothetical protein
MIALYIKGIRPNPLAAAGSLRMKYMTDNISTTVWPGPTHFGFGAAGMAGQEVRTLKADNVFILTDPGIISARLLEPVTSTPEISGERC